MTRTARSDATIDLRSDTVTLPSAGMRAAMASAAVGDDFYGDDPTVMALEGRAADVLGLQAALYVPSGTMGNLLAHLTHCPGGAEVVGPEASHSFTSEGGAAARVAGVSHRAVPQKRAELDLGRYAALTHDTTVLAPRTGLYWVEQPTRGHVVSLADLEGLRALAEERGTPIHMDGARIFNAAAALGIPAARIAGLVDSVMFCVSKGLGAPVGSLLVGTSEFVATARIQRQMVGGGMRQAGIVAAAGLYALEHNIARLADDHANARRLAAGIAGLPGLAVDRDHVETNMFTVEVTHAEYTAQQLADALAARGILVNRPAPGRRAVRFVTHLGVEPQHVEHVLEVIGELVADEPARVSDRSA